MERSKQLSLYQTSLLQAWASLPKHVLFSIAAEPKAMISLLNQLVACMSHIDKYSHFSMVLERREMFGRQRQQSRASRAARFAKMSQHACICIVFHCFGGSGGSSPSSAGGKIARGGKICRRPGASAPGRRQNFSPRAIFPPALRAGGARARPPTVRGESSGPKSS